MGSDKILHVTAPEINTEGVMEGSGEEEDCSEVVRQIPV